MGARRTGVATPTAVRGVGAQVETLGTTTAAQPREARKGAEVHGDHRDIHHVRRVLGVGRVAHVAHVRHISGIPDIGHIRRVGRASLRILRIRGEHHIHRISDDHIHGVICTPYVRAGCLLSIPSVLHHGHLGRLSCIGDNRIGDNHLSVDLRCVVRRGFPDGGKHQGGGTAQKKWENSG